MRLNIAVIAVVAAVALAGCSKDKEHDHDVHTCPDGTVLDPENFPDHDNDTFEIANECPGGGGNGTPPPPTTPNAPPTLNLVTFDSGGNATNVTVVGGSITFSAEGSSDSDGSIDGIAVTVNDGNRTNLVYELHDGERFKTATVVFDRPGVVAVTASMVDNRGAFSTLDTEVYVNLVQTVQTTDFHAILPAQGQDPCVGPTEAQGNKQDLIDQQVFAKLGFETRNETTYVTAAVVGGTTGTIAICSPDGISLSGDPAAEATSAPGTVFTDYDPDNSFYVGVNAGAPNTKTAVEYTVHFEAQPA